MKPILALLAPLAVAACVSAPGAEAPPAPVAANARSGAVALLPVLDAEAGATENVFFSPASIDQAFGVLHLGAAGATREQIEQVLPPPRDARGLAKDADGVEVRLANALWLSDRWRFRPEFVAGAANRYGATAERLDFARPGNVAATINAWADRATDGLIPQVVTADAVDPDGAAFITNALYFDGLWQTPFDSWKTEPFLHGDGKDRPFKLMRETMQLPVVRSDGWLATRLPYRNQRYVMDIVMPERREVMAAAPRPAVLAAMAAELEAATPRTVAMLLPQFEIDYDAGLIHALGAIGLTLPFDAARADLSALAEPGQRRLVVDAVQHIAKLQVFDIGTKAAAVTVMRIVPTAGRIEREPPFQFVVDRPFVVVIRDLDRGEVLFVGRIAAPQPFEPAVDGGP